MFSHKILYIDMLLFVWLPGLKALVLLILVFHILLISNILVYILNLVRAKDINLYFLQIVYIENIYNVKEISKTFSISNRYVINVILYV